MRRLAAIVAGLALPLALSTFAPAAGVASPSPQARGASGVVVELDQHRLDVGPGAKVSFESTVRNTGSVPLDGYVAHLNILSTDPGVYVDPEDWSPRRTQYLEKLPAGKTATLTWDVRAVTSGPLLLFVSVTSPTAGTVTSSAPLNLGVHGQRVVNAGGVLPMALWMPAGVLVLLGATSLRRRRHR